MKLKNIAIFALIAILVAGAGVAFYLRMSGTGPVAGIGQTFAINYQEDLDVTLTDRQFSWGEVTLEVSPTRPIPARKKSEFKMCIMRQGERQKDLQPELTFNMKMNMGHLNYRMLPTEDGCYRAEAVLPACMSGGKRWFGRARFSLAGKSYEKVFIFDVQ